jgi:hypothetical protein
VNPIGDLLNEVGGHCPTCGAEYRPGFDTCADDGTSLVPEPAPPATPPTPIKKPRPRPIHKVQTVLLTELPTEEARLLVGRLRADGIAAWLEVEEPYPYPVYPYGGIRTLRVFVTQKQLPDARRIAREFTEP